MVTCLNQSKSFMTFKVREDQKNRKICSYFCIIFERHLGGRFSRRFIHQFIKIKQAHDWYELNDHVTCDLCGEELHCGYNIKVEHGVIISIIFHFHTVTIFKRHTITSFCLKADIWSQKTIIKQVSKEKNTINSNILTKYSLMDIYGSLEGRGRGKGKGGWTS